MKHFKKIRRVAAEAFLLTGDKVRDFGKGCIQHTESIGILTLAAAGLTSLLSEIPFAVTAPLWVETPLVIPAVATVGVSALCKSAEMRRTRRQRKAEAADA